MKKIDWDNLTWGQLIENVLCYLFFTAGFACLSALTYGVVIGMLRRCG